MRETFWQQLADHLAAGEPARVVLVAENTRHSPGTRGARMFVSPNGAQVGTIGGGVMESRFARPWNSSEGVGIETLSHRAGAASPSGLICAGAQKIVAFDASPDDFETYRDFADACREDRLVSLRVVDGQPTLEAQISLDGPAIRLEGGHYVEHAVCRKRVAIMGGGHCGLALSRTLKGLGYRVEVFDDRDDVFTLEQNSWADRKTTVSNYAEAGALVAHSALTHVVVMTSNLPCDVDALAGVLGRDFPYVGVMGSSAKLAKIREELESRGVTPAALAGMYAPIGLHMVSDTPEEIAVSIAAQLLRERPKLFPWTRPKDSLEAP